MGGKKSARGKMDGDSVPVQDREKRQRSAYGVLNLVEGSGELTFCLTL